MRDVNSFTDAAGHHVDAVGTVRVLRRHKGTLILSGVVGVMMGAGLSFVMPPKYKAEGQLVVRSAALVSPESSQSFEATAVNEAVLNTEQEVLTSKGLLTRVAQRVDIPPELLPHPGWLQQLKKWLLNQRFAADWTDQINWLIPPLSTSPEAALDQRTSFVDNAITITNTKGSSVISVRSVTKQPQLSAAIVNSVIDLYMADRADQETHTGSRIEEALRIRIQQTRQQIEDGKAHLSQLFRQEGAVENGTIPREYQRLTLMEIERAKALVELAKRRAVYKSPADSAIQQALLDETNRQMSEQRRVRQAQSAVQIAVEGQRDAIASLWRLHEVLQAKLIDLTAHPTNLSGRVLTSALVPLEPSFPKPVIFTGIGGLLAVSTTFVVLLLRMQARSRRLIAMQFAQIVDAPLLASVPQFNTRASRRLLASASPGKLGNLGSDVYAAAIELEEAVKAGHFHSITVTSARAGEGKTTVATLIGRTLASMSLRILVIDLDLRQPGVERMLRAASPGSLKPDLLLLGSRTLGIQIDGKSNLHLYTPPASAIGDPLTYLRSAQLREIISQLRAEYDLLIFDTPPVLAIPDALMIAKLSDAVLLVSELGRNDEGDAAELSRRLANAQRPICGVVVTKAEATETYAGSGRMPASYR
jgi:Mrp family chromosome partitioning ATPase/capsular polysaccharide biosynthesis protein